MGDFADFIQMMRGRDPLAQRRVNGSEKALTITTGGALEPGGFVNEIRYRSGSLSHDNSTAGLQATRLRNELVFACIAARSDTAQDPMLLVQKRTKDEDGTRYETIKDHPFRMLLSQPNINMTEADLMRAAIVSWDISNPRRFYCEKTIVNGLLKEIKPLNPQYMKPKRGANGDTVGYRWDDGTYRQEYSLEDLIIRSAPVWVNPPPIVAANGSIGSDTAQTEYVRAFFENGGAPIGFLKYDQPLRQSQKDDIRAQWRSIYGNIGGGQFDVGVLDRATNYQEIGSRLDSLESEILRSIAESRACMVFRVPPLIIYAYVGLMRATYSNLKEAWASFWDATMSPLWREWRDFWAKNLLIEFEYAEDIRNGTIRLMYDLSQVAALQDDVDKAQDRARKNLVVGGITRNEFRADIGKPADLVDGDVYMRSPDAMRIVPTSSSDVAKQTAKVIQLKTGRKKPSLLVTERRIEDNMQKYLEAEYKRAADAVMAG